MKTVKIYSTDWCINCVEAKSFFKKHKVKYTEFNIEKNKKAEEEMIKKSGQSSIPVIEIGKVIIVGFKEKELKDALNLK